MKKGELKYILILAAMLLTFVLYQFFGKKPFDWRVTLYSNDTNPFGTYVLSESLPDLFESVEKSALTLYELEDSTYQNLFILCQNFYPGEEDIETLLNEASEGKNIFISADYMHSDLMDTLGIEMSDYQIDAPFFHENESDFDSVRLAMSGMFADGSHYEFPSDNVYSQFDVPDSVNIQVLAMNDAENPVFIRAPFGQGNIYLNSTPLIFSNLFLLQENNYELAGKLLSFLPAEQLHWTEYYQVGRMQSQTPLRYVLSEEALTWAYYLILAGLILFMIFEAKRKQRIIPVITPLRNSTLDFVHTVSNLYFQQKDHKSIAEKRISYFLETLRRTYFLPEHLQGRNLYKTVAAKSGHPEEEVEALFVSMFEIRRKSTVTETDLQQLNTRIENFSI